MGQRKLWNYTPELPVKTAPYWDWPARPVAAAVYLLKTWNPAGSRLLFLTVAIVVWTFFTPDLSRAQTLSLDWIPRPSVGWQSAAMRLVSTRTSKVSTLRLTEVLCTITWTGSSMPTVRRQRWFETTT